LQRDRPPTAQAPFRETPSQARRLESPWCETLTDHHVDAAAEQQRAADRHRWGTDVRADAG